MRREKGEIITGGAKYKGEVDKGWAKPGGLPARTKTCGGGEDGKLSRSAGAVPLGNTSNERGNGEGGAEAKGGASRLFNT